MSSPETSADLIDAVEIGYFVTAADFGGATVSVYVVDVYMLSDDPADTMLNIYNWNTTGGTTNYFQSFTGTGWQPTNLGGPFDTEALQRADTFVTIGGFNADSLQTPGTGAGSGLDPNFGGNNAAAPGVDAGWYNGSPPSLNGQAITYDNGVFGVLVGRFSSLGGPFSIAGTGFEATWNQGLGTPGNQAMFTVRSFITDCNGNSIDDPLDIADGFSFDCNSNGVPDECEIDGGTATDCNADGVLDQCQMDDGSYADCNGNGVLDACEPSASGPFDETFSTPVDGNSIEVTLPATTSLTDVQLSIEAIADLDSGVSGNEFLRISIGTWNYDLTGPQCGFSTATVLVPSSDWNNAVSNGQVSAFVLSGSEVDVLTCANTIRFVYSLGGTGCDCNSNGQDDSLDPDCNGNGFVDECELAGGQSADCDGNAIPDSCDIDTGASTDCNADGVPDSCQIADGTASDCDSDGVPDSCQIADGSITDCDQDGVLDICQSMDFDGDGTYDPCEGGLVGTDFPTIADAVLGAPDNGVVRVPSGTYNEQVILERGITIVGIDGPDSTILTRGSGPFRSIVIADGAPAGTTLQGFTITNGATFAPGTGGGIDARQSDVAILDCVIEGNGGTEGGGARFEGGSPVIVGCTFRLNTAQGLAGGLRLVESDATVRDCVFEENAAASGTLGWAMAVSDGNTNFDSVEVAFHGGQAIAIEELTNFPATTSTILGLFAHDNVGRGLALLTDDPEFCTLQDSRICGNSGSPTDGPFTDLGDNILFGDDCPDLVVPDDADTIQLAIDAAVDGERIAVRPGTYDEGGLDLSDRDLDLVGVDDLFLPKPTIIGSVNGSGMPSGSMIRHFSIRNGVGLSTIAGYTGLAVGGGLVLDDAGVTVEDCEIFDNTAAHGGGVFVRDGAVQMRNVYVAQNEASIDGGGIHAEGGAAMSLTLEGVLVVANLVPSNASTRGGGIDARGLTEPGSLIMGGTAIAGNTRENLAQNLNSGSYTDLGNNNIDLAFDCDGNGIEDAADIGDLGRADCNANLVPDDCDIAIGTSGDCDLNGVPDECDLASGAPDIDLDGVLDACQTQLVFSVPDRFPTIGSAIDVATDGARIQIGPGTYFEAIDLGTKELEVVGDPANPTSVLLDGFGINETLLRVAGGQSPSTLISGIHFKNGVATVLEPGSGTTLVGGALYLDGSSPIIEDCIIEDSTATKGGGVYARFSDSLFRRVLLRSNTSSAAGAGIFSTSSTLTLDSCELTSNTSQGTGGGWHSAVLPGQLLNSMVVNNTGVVGGGGIYVGAVTEPFLIESSTIELNFAGEADGGGGVFASQSGAGVAFLDSTVCSNVNGDVIGPASDLGGNELCGVCPFDLSGNGEVGAEDVGILLSQWGPCPSGCSADFNGDGEVRAADLGPLLGAWGACP